MAVKNKIYIPTFISSVDYQPVRVLPHIYFYNGLKSSEPFYVQHYVGSNTGSVTSSVQEAFPYFDNYEGLTPTTGSKSLLFFNETSVYGDTPTSSLYDTYWERYVSLLYNPKTRLFNCSAIIPLADYFEMELNDIVEWRGNRYHLRAINQYNLKDGTCELQLLGPIIADAVTPQPADCSFNFSSSLEYVDPALPLPVSRSLWSYIDVSNTSSYASGSTMYDLSGNGNNASILSSSLWNYVDSLANYPYINLSGSGQSIITFGPTSTSTTFSLLTAYYLGGYSTSETSSYVPLFMDFDNDPGNATYGLTLYNSASNQGITTMLDYNSIPANRVSLGAGTGASGSWYVVQSVYDYSNNVIRWNINGVTGSVTKSLIAPSEALQFDFGRGYTDYRIGDNTKLQVMAIYTGALTFGEMEQNYNILSPRYT